MSVIQRLQRVLMPAPEIPPVEPDELPDESSSAPSEMFHARAAALGADAMVLEVGTLRVLADRATHLQSAFPHVPRDRYVMADVQPGLDVDVEADLHALPADWTGRFDGFAAVAVFEHLERPWIAAREISRILKPGGFCFINTHQTFPLHGFPMDFFRFSKEALALIFRDAGMNVLDVAYQNRAAIIPPQTILAKDARQRWNTKWPSYINISLVAEKP